MNLSIKAFAKWEAVESKFSDPLFFFDPSTFHMPLFHSSWMSLTCPCRNSSLQNVRCLNVEDVLQQKKLLKIQWYNLVICIWRHRAASAAMSFPLVRFSNIATCVLVPLLHGGFKVGCCGNRLDHRSQAYEKVMDLIVMMSMLRLGCLLLICLKGTKSQNTYRLQYLLYHYVIITSSPKLLIQFQPVSISILPNI